VNIKNLLLSDETKSWLHIEDGWLIIVIKNVLLSDETKSWLHIADDWLTTLIKDNPDLCYHVVMLHGLMGNIKESHRQLSM
jgi:hypothetical protein